MEVNPVLGPKFEEPAHVELINDTECFRQLHAPDHEGVHLGGVLEDIHYWKSRLQVSRQEILEKLQPALSQDPELCVPYHQHNNKIPQNGPNCSKDESPASSKPNQLLSAVTPNQIPTARIS